MKIVPHIVIHNSMIPRLVGKLIVGYSFTAWTYLCLTWLSNRRILEMQLTAEQVATVIRHEYRHVQQWAVVTLAWWVLFALVLHPVWYAYVLALLFGHSIAVGVAGIIASLRGSGYRNNWFEADARRHAGE